VIRNLLVTFALLYLFLIGVECLSKGIRGIGGGQEFFAAFGDQGNPVLGLLVGILTTTLVQSSSVTTALIVGLVGAGQISVTGAVPMIMGANIGTTVTNTIAALAHMTRSTEFRRAFAAATCHDFFNFLSVLLLLPLELITRAIWGKGMLESMAHHTVNWTMGISSSTDSVSSYNSPFKSAIKSGYKVVNNGIEGLFGTDGTTAKYVLAVVGMGIIFAALTGVVKSMRVLVMARMERYMNRFLGSGGFFGIIIGIILTVLVQSSSITTSVLVPLAGAGMVTLQQIFPITIGANIGTTVTAMLASFAITNEPGDPDGVRDGVRLAREIAFVHLYFNLVGMLVWFVPRVTRQLPLMMAEWMADFAVRKRKWAVAYVMGIFYALPAGIFFLSRLF
jgi:sodium-dependent phosphate cotransporter